MPGERRQGLKLYRRSPVIQIDKLYRKDLIEHYARFAPDRHPYRAVARLDSFPHVRTGRTLDFNPAYYEHQQVLSYYAHNPDWQNITSQFCDEYEEIDNG